ncbi:MAG: hypothetical protein H7Y38_14155 [Armatimonadetes bacterium]|nr:hypothetical protein [Armatimonadota bacterium]
MTRRSFSDTFYQIYSFLLCVLTATVGIRLFCEYSWFVSALYGVATVASFYAGHTMVAILQSKEGEPEPAHQESDSYDGR